VGSRAEQGDGIILRVLCSVSIEGSVSMAGSVSIAGLRAPQGMSGLTTSTPYPEKQPIDARAMWVLLNPVKAHRPVSHELMLHGLACGNCARHGCRNMDRAQPSRLRPGGASAKTRLVEPNSATGDRQPATAATQLAARWCYRAPRDRRRAGG